MSDSEALTNPSPPSPLIERGFPSARDLDPELAGPHGSSRGRSWHTRCRFIKKNGDQCGNWAMKGGVVCRVAQHGGAFPNVKALARKRLEHMAEMSIEEYRYAMLPYSTRRDRLRAATMTLRMTGLVAMNVDRALREDDVDQIDALIASLKKGKEAA